MTAHAPKTAALIAYAEGLLSAKGRARVERHLAGCAVCRRELAAIELYDRMVEDAREAPVPVVDYGRMELALAREANRVSGEIRAARRWTWAPIALAAAAAVGLAVWAGWPRGTETTAPVAERPEMPDTTPAPAPEAAPLTPVVTLAAGAAVRLTDGAPEPLAPGDVVPEGARVSTGEASALHVRMRDGTGFVARAQTVVALTEAREDAIRLTLEGGAIEQRVATLSHGSTYVVLAAGYEVEVRGTDFVVSYVDGVVGVDLSDGVLEVRPPDGEPFELTAPARWRSGGSGDAAGDTSDTAALTVPRELDCGDAGCDGWIPVTLADPRIVRWEIDGTPVPAAEAALRVRSGEHRIQGWDLRDRLYVALVPVDGAAFALSPDALRPEGPQIRPGHLEPEEIAPVLQRGRRQLRSCYEASLRRGSSISGRINLRVTLDVMGDVRRVRVLGLDGAGADELTQCVNNYVSRWTFPPPGGPLTFDVPLNLTTAR